MEHVARTCVVETKSGTKRKRKKCSCKSRRSRRESLHRSPTEVRVKILSATYGPCEHNNGLCDEVESIPSTRDCSSFLTDLLVACWTKEQGLSREESLQMDRVSSRVVRLPPTVDGKIQSFICLLPGVDCGDNLSRLSTSTVCDDFVSMNAIFGDPCPGITKRLGVRYTVTEIYPQGMNSIASRTEIHRVTFAEHEAVTLRRRLATITGFNAENESEHCLDCRPKNDSRVAWEFRPEIVLPIVLPFLNLWERMQCRLICRGWKKLVQECGVSRTIDINNTNLMPRVTQPLTGRKGSDNSNVFTPSMLRGLLGYSYSSLQSLFLSGFRELQQDDLHSALPHLQNLRVLDVSYCVLIEDSTLQLLAHPDVPTRTTLRVLYLKGLRNITDSGLRAICASCKQLEVLDLSHLNRLTDDGGKCIQQLVSLRALFLRDNWQLTNGSLDAITTSCTKLEQLTLWGCVRFRRLTFTHANGTNDSVNATSTHNRLVILNLWGCHDLEDDTAEVLSRIPHLKTLIVSECHRLTDRFLETFVEGAERHNKKEHLQHLHLRYLKRITDVAVIAVATHLRNLLSLDLSFCSKLTARGIYRLLDELRESLLELRLVSCKRLQISKIRGDPRLQPSNIQNRNHAGNWILNALRRRPHSTLDHSLCLLDLRGCGGQSDALSPYPNDDPFVKGMEAIAFAQKVPGFFTRSSFA